MAYLLIFVPIAVALKYLASSQYVWIFCVSGLAIVPLAGMMSEATEQLAERTGSGVGGLLNATFGNAAELIIAFAALREGLYEVVKASLAGAIVGNILFVLGLSMLAGGLRHREQTFNAAGVRSQATMLTLATIALILPAAYVKIVGPSAEANIRPLSLWISILLLVVYAGNLVFSLITHRSLFEGSPQKNETHNTHAWSVQRAVLTLAGSTILVAWMSEILVGALEPTTQVFGLNPMFVGVFVVAVFGTAAEQVSAVRAALKNRMDLTLSIAMGSSVQMSLFVSPLLVLVSAIFLPVTMDLVFSGGLVLTILLSVLITGQIAGDGRSDWLKGVQLLAVYLILALVFYFTPSAVPR